jgi:Polyketide synthase dehydratase
LAAKGGIALGPCFQGIHSLWIGTNEALGEIRNPDGITELDGPIHPCVLDACVHVIGVAHGTDFDKTYCLLNGERWNCKNSCRSVFIAMDVCLQAA